MTWLQSIEHEVNRLRIIDGHEHLITSEMRRKGQVGFFGLMHYLESDLITAGMQRGALDARSALSDEEKVKLFLTYWNHTRNTTYARMFKTAMEDLYDFQDWSAGGILEVNERVKANSADPAWYHTVLKEKSGIDLAITLIQTNQVDFELFRPVMFMDFTYKLRTWKDILAVAKVTGTSVQTLEDYLGTVDALLDKYVKEGMVATKLGHAYWRTLAITKPELAEAKRVYVRLMELSEEEGVLSPEEVRPLEDYLIRHVVQGSAARGLPIQIHTGHHETSVSSDGNVITNSRVTGLIPLFLEYEDAQFVLLHSGLPYQDEYLSIAKNFANVYADMTWVYIISPTAAKRILHQMIEMVPQSKLLAFGGDYNYIEGTYAHQKLARRLLAEVLSEKVAERMLTEEEAIEFAYRVLRGNLLELYDLKLY